jgi:hypothetical protein
MRALALLLLLAGVAAALDAPRSSALKYATQAPLGAGASAAMPLGSAAEKDRVASLPGQPTDVAGSLDAPSQLFTGYVDVAPGRSLFYALQTAPTRQRATDEPLVLWLKCVARRGGMRGCTQEADATQTTQRGSRVQFSRRRLALRARPALPERGRHAHQEPARALRGARYAHDTRCGALRLTPT